MKNSLIAAVIAMMAGIAVSANATEPPSPPSISVAVLPFHQAAAKEAYAPLAEAVGDMVMVRLSAVKELTVVDRESIKKVLKELELSLLLPQSEKIRVGRIVGAKFVLTGSLTAVGDDFQINAHLLDVSTARVARSAKASARGDRLLDSLDQLVQELVGELKLKLPALTAEQIDKSPEANLHFMRGLGYHFGRLPDDALVEFMKVLAIDPLNARARFWSGMAYFDQREYDHAKLEFSRFLKQNGEHELAPRAKQLLAECESEARKPRQGGSP
jgi:TolB-like protein